MSSKTAQGIPPAAASEQGLRRSIRTASSDRPSYRSLLHPRDEDTSTDSIAGARAREAKRPRVAHVVEEGEEEQDRSGQVAARAEEGLEAAPGSNYCDEHADALAQLAEVAVLAEQEEQAQHAAAAQVRATFCCQSCQFGMHCMPCQDH